MKQTNIKESQSFLFSYGMMSVFVIVIILISLVLGNIEIGNRVAVKIVNEHGGRMYCSVPKGVSKKIGDTLRINVDNVGLRIFIVSGKEIRCGENVLRVSDFGKNNKRNRFYISDGYLYVGKKRLLDIVL